LPLPSSVPEAVQDAEPEHPDTCSEAPIVLEALDKARWLMDGRRCDLGWAEIWMSSEMHGGNSGSFNIAPGASAPCYPAVALQGRRPNSIRRCVDDGRLRETSGAPMVVPGSKQAELVIEMLLNLKNSRLYRSAAKAT
jgi:hypothetical protein